MVIIVSAAGGTLNLCSQLEMELVALGSEESLLCLSLVSLALIVIILC